MSNTPRTDEAFSGQGIYAKSNKRTEAYVRIDFARQLETEINGANKAIEELCAGLDDMAKQKLSSEMEDDDLVGADFEESHNCFALKARKLLAKYRKAAP